MTLLNATDKPVLYAVQDGSTTIISDITPVGSATGVSERLTAVSDTDENVFLGKMAGNASGYTPLPDTGTLMEAGEIYRYNNDLVIIRQTHRRTADTPATIPALILTYRAEQDGALQWVANESILLGMEREFNGILYVAIQPHKTVVGQTPDITPALWNRVKVGSEWKPDTFYETDEIVTFEGQEYTCRQAHTSQVGWEPPNVPALWSAV